MIYYKKPFEVSQDFINDILNIDAAVYDEHLRGTYKSVHSRFAVNQESYILAYSGLKLVGYICFFPISNDLSRRMQTENKCFDDNIKAEDVLSSYCESETDIDVFFISIAVLPEFNGRGIAKNLMNEALLLLSDKIQNGCRIRNILSYAYTIAGAAILDQYGFSDEKRLMDEETKNPVYFMKYTFDDFKKTNMYMFVPFSVNEKHGKFIKQNPEHNKNAAAYKKRLETVSKNEFSADLLKKLKREFLGRETFFIIDDENTKTIAERECDIYVTFYKNNYIATLMFEGLAIDPTTLLNQASIDNLYIKDKNDTSDQFKPPSLFKRVGDNLLKPPSFFDYLAGKFDLKTEDIDYAGETRTFTSLTQMPQTVHLMHMLACENYVKSYVNTHLTSALYFEKAQKNIAQYDFSKIYTSDHSVIYVLKNADDDRLNYESLMVFIMELLSLQLSSLHSSYDEIVSAMADTKFDAVMVERVNMRFSKGAVLWDINNFNYPAARHLFEIISKEFDIPRLKEEHRSNQSVFEKITTMQAQKEIAKYSKAAQKSSQITQKYFMFFSILSAIGTLGSIVGLVVDTSQGVLKSIITLILGSVAVVIFVAIILFNRRYLKERKLNHNEKESVQKEKESTEKKN